MLSNNFCKAFDLSKNKFQPIGSLCIWQVTESDKHAKLKRLEIDFRDVDFVGFDQYLTKNMPCFTDRSSTFFDKECDGVAFVSDGDKEGLLFVELKSSCAPDTISKAINQMCFSLFKLHSMLSLCQAYSLDNLNIRFCVAVSKEDSDRSGKNILFVKEMEIADRQIGKVYRELFLRNRVKTDLCCILNLCGITFPLTDLLKKKQVVVFLVKSDDVDGDNASFTY